MPASTRLLLACLGASGQWVVTTTAAGATGTLTHAVAVSERADRPRRLHTRAARASAAGQSRRHGPTRSRRDDRGRPVRAVVGARRHRGAARVRDGLDLDGLAVYPPRGIDDVTYHLPPIYQAIQDHRLTVLPIELRGHFGYPLNAEMLFLLVPLFTGSIRGSPRHKPSSGSSGCSPCTRSDDARRSHLAAPCWPPHSSARCPSVFSRRRPTMSI